MAIVAWILVVVGLILCFVGRLPGQVLAYVGMLLFNFSVSGGIYPAWLLILLGVLVVCSVFVNYKIAPKLAKKVHEFGKGGKWGTVLGSALALTFMLCGTGTVLSIILFLVLPYAFAFLFEYSTKKDVSEGAKRGAGAYTLFLATTFINIAVCAFCIYKMIGF